MILFRPEHRQPILDGLKTQTRRTGRRRWRVPSTHQARTRMLDARSAFALIGITSVRRQALRDISDEDVLREGYPTLDAYRRIWEEINGRGSWDWDLDVWVLDFTLVIPLRYEV